MHAYESFMCEVLEVVIFNLFFILFYKWTPSSKKGGQFILTLVNHNGADFIIYITAMFEIIAVSWVYGVNRFCDDIKLMLGKETEIYWKICWAFIMPVGLFVLLVYFFVTYKSLLHEGAQFPTSALGKYVIAFKLVSVIYSNYHYKQHNDMNTNPGLSYIPSNLFSPLKFFIKTFVCMLYIHNIYFLLSYRLCKCIFSVWLVTFGNHTEYFAYLCNQCCPQKPRKYLD